MKKMSLDYQATDKYLTIKSQTIIIRNLLLVCFVLQQFGVNFHLSFGSLGLVLMAFLFRNKLSVTDFKVPLILISLVVLSFIWVLVKYGYDDQILRVFPVSIAILFLFSLLKPDRSIESPPVTFLVGVTLIISLVVWYQIFVDRALQVPEYLFAMGSNSSFSEDVSKYEFAKNALRSNGIYSEPSYMGMVLCCLFAFIFKSTGWLRNIGLLIIIVTQLISGSALGIIGLFFLMIVLVGRSSFKHLITVFVFGLLAQFIVTNMTAINFDFSFGDRIESVASASDGSTQARLISPFFLIYENIANFDWFGVPSNYFDHFLYTYLYVTMGDFPGHNGLLGMIMLYGIGGVAILYVLFSRLKNPLEWILVIIIGSQNGGFVTYEKVFSLLYVILTIRGAFAR